MNNADFFAKISLFISAIAIIVCFVLLTQLLNWHFVFILFGILLALPNFIVLAKTAYYRIGLTSNMVALCIVVLLASVLLWQALLNDTRIDLSANLLVLILALVIALAQQLLWLNYRPDLSKTSLQKQLENALFAPSIINTLCIAVIVVGAFMAFLSSTEIGWLDVVAIKFLDRGIIPPITLSLFFWGGLLLFSKWLMMQLEMDRFNRKQRSAFYLTYEHAKQNKITRSHVIEVLWQQFEAFYAIPRYINWAMPILGFIGTVLGISLATQGLGVILKNQESGLEQLLASALTPLGIAFDTTLIALSLSIVLALMQTLLYRWEERHIHYIEEKL